MVVKQTFSGGCSCGKIRYRAERASANAYYCHCRMCQRAFGNIFSTLFTISKSDVTWTRGTPTYFTSSKIARRGFCPECGTPLTFDHPGENEMDLSVGSLDEPGRMHPTQHWGVESRVASFGWDDEIPKLNTTEDPKLVALWKDAYGEEAR